MVKILDCTTRDGGHSTNWNYEPQYIENLMTELNNSEVCFYEIGYRNHYDKDDKGNFYNCTPEFLKPYYNNKGNLKLVIMTDAKRYSQDDFLGKENDYIDYVRIATHPEQIPQTLEIAKDLYNKGYGIFIQLMDVSNISLEGYMALFEWKHKNIIESLYFADSYGTLTPEDIENYYNKLRTLGYEKISFHGHNQTGKVLENTLQAIEIGAYSIDTTIDGIGRFGGNLKLKDLLTNMS